MKGESKMNEARVMEAIKIILEEIGEDPSREGLEDTPRRVMKLFKEIYSGIGTDPKEELSAVFEENHKDMVLVKDIPFYSTCEHHLVPFYGKAHIAYKPNGKVVGLSKIVRLVENVSRRPQVQERMTTMIADAIQEQLLPEGVMVVITAEHLCISMRGIKKPGSQTTTITTRGVFEDNDKLQNNFFNMLKV